MDRGTLVCLCVGSSFVLLPSYHLLGAGVFGKSGVSLEGSRQDYLKGSFFSRTQEGAGLFYRCIQTVSVKACFLICSLGVSFLF